MRGAWSDEWASVKNVVVRLSERNEVMPILSLRIVSSPRKVRYCENCGKRITGEQIRLYGMADYGDKPYNVFLHRECVVSKDASAMLRAAELQRASAQSGDENLDKALDEGIKKYIEMSRDVPRIGG